MGLWAFAKRHKKKLIFTGALAGGGYAAYKFLLPRLQQYALQKLLQDSDLKDFLGELEKFGQNPDQAKDSPEVLFEHKQQVSDSYVKRDLPTVFQKLSALFSCEELSENLQRAKQNGESKEAKLACFKALQSECFSKAASSLFLLEALLILHRVEFNIVGREMNTMQGSKGSVKEDTEAHTAFIDSTRYLKEDGIQRIADAVRRAVDVCSQRAEMEPTTKVTSDAIETFLIDVFAEATNELLSKKRSVETLLPASIDQEVDDAHQGVVKRCLDEARDYLESPQLLEVFTGATTAAAKRVGSMLSTGSDEKPALLGEGKSSPAGKLTGFFIQVSQSALNPDDGDNEFVSLFAEETKVRQFCEGIYNQA